MVIAGQEVPLNGVRAPHPLQRLAERAGRERFHVVDVTSDQDVPGVVLAGIFSQTRYGSQSCVLQETHRGVINKSEYLPDLLVGGVDQTNRHYDFIIKRSGLSGEGLLNPNAGRSIQASASSLESNTFVACAKISVKRMPHSGPSRAQQKPSRGPPWCP